MMLKDCVCLVLGVSNNFRFQHTRAPSFQAVDVSPWSETQASFGELQSVLDVKIDGLLCELVFARVRVGVNLQS
jgi:hypothetical protein